MSHVIHRSLRDDPPVAIAGRGVWLQAAGGAWVIDGSGGAAVACLGHGHPRVLAAMRAQLDRLAYAHTGLFSCEAAEALAHHLVGHAPGGLTHAWFCSSGSEACEAAIKLARQAAVERGEPERVHIIARRQSYHGNTLGALAAGGNAARRAPYAPLLAPNFHHVAPCYAYRDQGDDTEAEYLDRLLAEFAAMFDRLGPGNVLAVMAETVVGATLGCVPAIAGYFAGLRALCDRHGALLILDEVMCGMGRCGTLHAWEEWGVAPDIQIIAKGLGGGFQPIGGILAAERVVAPLRAGSGGFAHGHTYQAHPIACAAALAVQQVIAEDALVPRVAALGEQLGAALTERLGNHPHVGDIRGRGLFWAVELVANRATRAPFDPGLRVHERVKQAAFEGGLACYPMGGTIDGVRGDHAILAPPYISTDAEIEIMVERFATAIESGSKGLSALGGRGV